MEGAVNPSQPCGGGQGRHFSYAVDMECFLSIFTCSIFFDSLMYISRTLVFIHGIKFPMLHFCFVVSAGN